MKDWKKSVQIHLMFIDEFDSPNVYPTWQVPQGSPPQLFKSSEKRLLRGKRSQRWSGSVFAFSQLPGIGKRYWKPMEFGDFWNGYHRAFRRFANSRTLQNEMFSRLWTWKLMLNTYEHIPLLGIHQLQCRVKTHYILVSFGLRKDQTQNEIQ